MSQGRSGKLNASLQQKQNLRPHIPPLQHKTPAPLWRENDAKYENAPVRPPTAPNEPVPVAAWTWDVILASSKQHGTSDRPYKSGQHVYREAFERPNSREGIDLGRAISPFLATDVATASSSSGDPRVEVRSSVRRMAAPASSAIGLMVDAQMSGANQSDSHHTFHASRTRTHETTTTTITQTKTTTTDTISLDMAVKPRAIGDGAAMLSYGSEDGPSKYTTAMLPALRVTERDELHQLSEALDFFVSKLDSQRLRHLRLDDRSSVESLLAILKEEQGVYDLFFEEIIRQVAVQCRERGDLLSKIRSYYSNMLLRIPMHLYSIQSELSAQQKLNHSLQEENRQLREQSFAIQVELGAYTHRFKEAAHELEMYKDMLSRAEHEKDRARALFAQFREEWEQQRHKLEEQVAALKEEREDYLATASATATALQRQRNPNMMVTSLIDESDSDEERINARLAFLKDMAQDDDTDLLSATILQIERDTKSAGGSITSSPQPPGRGLSNVNGQPIMSLIGGDDIQETPDEGSQGDEEKSGEEAESALSPEEADARRRERMLAERKLHQETARQTEIARREKERVAAIAASALAPNRYGAMSAAARTDSPLLRGTPPPLHSLSALPDFTMDDADALVPEALRSRKSSPPTQKLTAEQRKAKAEAKEMKDFKLYVASTASMAEAKVTQVEMLAAWESKGGGGETAEQRAEAVERLGSHLPTLPREELQRASREPKQSFVIPVLLDFFFRVDSYPFNMNELILIRAAFPGADAEDGKAGKVWVDAVETELRRLGLYQVAEQLCSKDMTHKALLLKRFDLRKKAGFDIDDNSSEDDDGVSKSKSKTIDTTDNNDLNALMGLASPNATKSAREASLQQLDAEPAGDQTFAAKKMKKKIAREERRRKKEAATGEDGSESDTSSTTHRTTTSHKRASVSARGSARSSPAASPVLKAQSRRASKLTSREKEARTDSRGKTLADEEVAGWKRENVTTGSEADDTQALAAALPNDGQTSDNDEPAAAASTHPHQKQRSSRAEVSTHRRSLLKNSKVVVSESNTPTRRASAANSPIVSRGPSRSASRGSSRTGSAMAKRKTEKNAKSSEASPKLGATAAAKSGSGAASPERVSSAKSATREQRDASAESSPEQASVEANPAEDLQPIDLAAKSKTPASGSDDEETAATTTTRDRGQHLSKRRVSIDSPPPPRSEAPEQVHFMSNSDSSDESGEDARRPYKSNSTNNLSSRRASLPVHATLDAQVETKPPSLNRPKSIALSTVGPAKPKAAELPIKKVVHHRHHSRADLSGLSASRTNSTTTTPKLGSRLAHQDAHPILTLSHEHHQAANDPRANDDHEMVYRKPDEQPPATAASGISIDFTNPSPPSADSAHSAFEYGPARARRQPTESFDAPRSFFEASQVLPVSKILIAPPKKGHVETARERELQLVIQDLLTQNELLHAQRQALAKLQGVKDEGAPAIPTVLGNFNSNSSEASTVLGSANAALIHQSLNPNAAKAMAADAENAERQNALLSKVNEYLSVYRAARKAAGGASVPTGAAPASAGVPASDPASSGAVANSLARNVLAGQRNLMYNSRFMTMLRSLHTAPAVREDGERKEQQAAFNASSAAFSPGDASSIAPSGSQSSRRHNAAASLPQQQFSLAWLVKWLRSMYDAKLSRDDIARKENTPILRFPEFILEVQRKQFGLESICAKKTSDIVMSLNKFRDGDREVGFFVSFLEESRSLDELILFLRTRAVVYASTVGIRWAGHLLDRGTKSCSEYISLCRARQVIATIFSSSVAIQDSVYRDTLQRAIGWNQLPDPITKAKWEALLPGKEKQIDERCILLIDFLDVVLSQFRAIELELRHQQWAEELFHSSIAASNQQQLLQQQQSGGKMIPIINNDDARMDFASFQQVFALAEPTYSNREIAQLYANVTRNAGLKTLSKPLFKKLIHNLMNEGVMFPLLKHAGYENAIVIRLVMRHWHHFRDFFQYFYHQLSHSEYAHDIAAANNLRQIRFAFEKELTRAAGGSPPAGEDSDETNSNSMTAVTRRVVTIYRGLLNVIGSHQSAFMLHTLDTPVRVLHTELKTMQHIIVQRHRLHETNESRVDTWLENIAMLEVEDRQNDSDGVPHNRLLSVNLDDGSIPPSAMPSPPNNQNPRGTSTDVSATTSTVSSRVSSVALRQYGNFSAYTTPDHEVRRLMKVQQSRG